MDDARKVGLVTVTFDSGSVVDGFMKSALAQSHSNFVLYVVDSGSKDETLDRVAAYRDPRIRTIPNTENIGVAAGNNQGIRASLEDGCDFVLLINNDTEFGSDLLEKLLAGIEEHGADMVTPKIMYFDEPRKIWCAGGYIQRLRPFANGHYGLGQIDRGQFDEARAVRYAPTCCMLIRRHVFDAVGLMDERYFVYFDDMDFCLRATRAGMKLVYLPEAVLYHKVSSLTAGDQSSFTIKYWTRNQAYYIRKNLSPAVQAYSIGYCLLSFALRVVRRKDSVDQFLLRQQAFHNGLVMFGETRA